MVGRRDPGHRGQGGVRHGSILRDIHKNLCMGHGAFQGRHGLVRCNPGAVAPSMPDRGTAEVSAQPLKLFASAAMHAAAAAAVQLNEAERNQSRTRHAHHVSRWRKQMASAFAARLIALSGVLRWSTPHTARSAQLPSQSKIKPVEPAIEHASETRQQRPIKRQSTQQHTVC